MSLMKDNFVNQLIISLFHTTLIAFLNFCNMVKTTYILERRDYNWNTKWLYILTSIVLFYFTKFLLCYVFFFLTIFMYLLFINIYVSIIYRIFMYLILFSSIFLYCFIFSHTCIQIRDIVGNTRVLKIIMKLSFWIVRWKLRV
jgi:hypothetical protein